jgi:hypothetical protein
MGVTCSAIARSGSRCQRPALAGKQHCLMHDPASAELRREASRKGGKARANAERAKKLIPSAMSPEELGGRLSDVFLKVVDGKLSPKIGTAASTIARALIDVRTAGELEERLAELERRADLSDRRSA